MICCTYIVHGNNVCAEFRLDPYAVLVGDCHFFEYNVLESVLVRDGREAADLH